MLLTQNLMIFPRRTVQKMTTQRETSEDLEDIEAREVTHLRPSVNVTGQMNSLELCKEYSPVGLHRWKNSINHHRKSQYTQDGRLALLTLCRWY